MSELDFSSAPRSNLWKSVPIALVVLAILAAAFFYFNPRQAAVLTVPGTQIYAAHTAFATERGEPGTNVIGAAPHTEDDIYIVANVYLEDQLRFGMRINDITGMYTAPDGSTMEAYAAGAVELSRLKEVFPGIAPLVLNPINDSTPLAPSTPVEGTVVLHFPGLTEAAWKARKSATLTVNLIQQPPLTATIP